MLADRFELAREIASREFGDVDEVVHMPYGHACLTFHVSTGQGDFILKTSDQLGAFDHTVQNIERLAALGIPVPRVCKTGIEGDIRFLITEMIPGRDLGLVLGEMTEPQMSRLAEQIVDVQRRAASLAPGAGYGWTPIDVPGPFATWTELVLRDSAGAGESVRRHVEAMKPYLDAVAPTCFLDDITVKNVIIEQGQLQGIVDLDFVCYGDPMWMLALTETTVVLDVGFHRLFYVKELRRFWELSPSQSRAVALYESIHTSAFLNRPTLTSTQRVNMETLLNRNLGIL